MDGEDSNWDWSSNASNWDSFVQTDYVRNELVIPYLLNQIDSKKGDIVVGDIGCGTGYIASKLLSLREEKIEKLLLLDVVPQLLCYSEGKYFSCPALNGKVLFVNLDLRKHPLESMQINIAYLIFTLLEFRLSRQFVANLGLSIAEDGEVVIVYPDVLLDVSRSPEQLARYCYDGYSSLNKCHIVNGNYPFHANRIEFIIEAFTACRFILVELKRTPFSSNGSNNGIFFMRFKKANHA